jgi:hypothetical protein
MMTTLVVEYDFSHHNYNTIVTMMTTLVVEYDFSHHNYNMIITMRWSSWLQSYGSCGD